MNTREQIITFLLQQDDANKNTIAELQKTIASLQKQIADFQVPKPVDPQQ